jgi:predicted kinase
MRFFIKPLSQGREVMSQMQTTLIAIGGLSGTGKTTLSENLTQIFAEFANPPSNASISSDIVRKTLWAQENGQEPDLYSPLPVEAYSSAYGVKAHEKMLADIKANFDCEIIIVDATFAKPETRTDIENLAHDNNAKFIGLWLEAPIDTIKQRADARAANEKTISDANSMVIDLQIKAGTGDVNWTKINTDQDKRSITSNAIGAIIPALR